MQIIYCVIRTSPMDCSEYAAEWTSFCECMSTALPDMWCLRQTFTCLLIYLLSYLLLVENIGFLPHDAMLARYTVLVSVSVCHTPVLYQNS